MFQSWWKVFVKETMRECWKHPHLPLVGVFETGEERELSEPADGGEEDPGGDLAYQVDVEEAGRTEAGGRHRELGVVFGDQELPAESELLLILGDGLLQGVHHPGHGLPDVVLRVPLQLLQVDPDILQEFSREVGDGQDAGGGGGCWSWGSN